jgi:hypothetical protein
MSDTVVEGQSPPVADAEFLDRIVVLSTGATCHRPTPERLCQWARRPGTLSIQLENATATCPGTEVAAAETGYIQPGAAGAELSHILLVHASLQPISCPIYVVVLTEGE